MSLAEAEAKELQVDREVIVGRWTDARQRMLRNPSAVIGLILIAIFVLVAVFAPLLAPYPPGEQDLSLIRPGVIPGPSPEHLLGVDQLGRDILSRIIYGARVSLGVAIPSSPGFVGTYQWLAVASLGVLDVAREDALAFSILLHGSWYLPTTIVGGLVVIFRLDWGIRRPG